mmetsp:Transcript_3354/g.9235  ORF Transcript_3354/g.9235 Transcript_3354/m.9235 type:complete len:306 (-) Transcript_3354:941-1858(-)
MLLMKLPVVCLMKLHQAHHVRDRYNRLLYRVEVAFGGKRLQIIDGAGVDNNAHCLVRYYAHFVGKTKLVGAIVLGRENVLSFSFSTRLVHNAAARRRHLDVDVKMRSGSHRKRNAHLRSFSRVFIQALDRTRSELEPDRPAACADERSHQKCSSHRLHHTPPCHCAATQANAPSLSSALCSALALHLCRPSPQSQAQSNRNLIAFFRTHMSPYALERWCEADHVFGEQSAHRTPKMCGKARLGSELALEVKRYDAAGGIVRVRVALEGIVNVELLEVARRVAGLDERGEKVADEDRREIVVRLTR